MFDIDKWREIWATISRNKVRSLLTAFGVSWGLFMFIILVGYGNGFKTGITDQFAGVATNSCFFWCDRTGEAYKGHRKGRWWHMDSNDLRIIREKARTVNLVAPMLMDENGGQTVRGNKTGSYTALGVYPDLFEMNKMYMIYGRLLNEIDIAQNRKVCVIGKVVYETLFKIGEDPIGQTIRVNGIYYSVVGVVYPVSPNFNIFSNAEETVYIPFTTMKHTTSIGDEFWFIGCTARDGVPASVTEDEIRQIIMANHEIAPTDVKAFPGVNLEKQFKMFDNLFIGINILIWIVGMGALLSGVIGISNIMLVTVRERMREIGVRRALGASPFTILSQIMSESLVLTTIAGLAGFIVGVGILAIVQQATGAAPSGEEVQMRIVPFVSFKLAITAMVILIISGIIAGLMPAMKALRIKAIDAIRDE